MLTLRILELFAAAGIRSAPLKGPFLGEAIHGDPGRRLSSDVDLLVAPEQLQEAVQVARGLGYGDPTDHLLADGLPLLHLRMLDPRRKLPPLELHWRVHWYERDFARQRLLPPRPGPWEGWRPAPADELAALLLFYARDGFIDLRIATDISAWWDARGGELEAEGNARGAALADAGALARGGPPEEEGPVQGAALAEARALAQTATGARVGGPAEAQTLAQGGALAPLLHAYPQLARVLPAAAHVAQKVVGLPAARLLEGAPGPRERLAVRLANPHPTSTQSQLYADMGLVDGLLAPRGGFREFVRRQLLPPEEVLDQQARHGQRSGARSSSARFLGVLARYALTVARSTLARTRSATR